MNLKKMEEYLKRVLTEYEQYHRSFEGESSIPPLSKLKELQEYIDPYQEMGCFNRDFIRPFFAVVNRVQESIT